MEIQKWNGQKEKAKKENHQKGNNQKVNYQKVLDQTLEQLLKEKRVPKLLLHSCCAPCSSYVLEYLSE